MAHEKPQPKDVQLYYEDKTVTVRPPKTRDLMAVKDIPNPVDQEVALIINLTELTRDEVDSLEAADYFQLQAVVLDFQRPPK